MDFRLSWRARFAPKAPHLLVPRARRQPVPTGRPHLAAIARLHWVRADQRLAIFRNEAITSQRNRDAVLSEYTRNRSVTPVCCKGLTGCETFRFRDVSGGNPRNLTRSRGESQVTGPPLIWNRN
jgi:hypothetical protein